MKVIAFIISILVVAAAFVLSDNATAILYCLLTGFLLVCIRLLLAQYVQRKGEPPLFGGSIPYLGLAAEFGTDHAALLRSLSKKSGEAPAFTCYIAGQRMTFVKNPLHFKAVLREGKKRLQFRPVAQKIMSSAFAVTEDMDSHNYDLWEKQSPPQWSMLRGKPLLELMANTQEELVVALHEYDTTMTTATATTTTTTNVQEWHNVDDLYAVVVDLMWQATGRSFFGTLFDDENGDMKKARASFQCFDDNFPLLAGGVPVRITRGVCFYDSSSFRIVPYTICSFFLCLFLSSFCIHT